MKDGPLLRVQNISVAYGETEVLTGASCSAYPEEIVCIVGESGCGKTTLLKAVLGLVETHRGHIFLFDKEIATLDELERQEQLLRVGVLFQNGALLASMNMEENISVALEQHTSLPEDVRRRMVEVKLDLVNLGGVQNKLPAELSGGMKKRAALARALIMDPEIVFLDEPSAGLDPVTSAALDRLILSLRDRLNTTFVVVTHELASISTIADRIVFLDKGRVVFEGTLEEAQSSEEEGLVRFFARQAPE
jgi:phospholipid/cholesterol/gamma-HCH transport system ATP-binding protein